MDKLPVDSNTSKRVMLGTDELTVLATSVETGGALFAAMNKTPEPVVPKAGSEVGLPEGYDVTEILLEYLESAK